MPGRKRCITGVSDLHQRWRRHSRAAPPGMKPPDSACFERLVTVDDLVDRAERKQSPRGKMRASRGSAHEVQRTPRRQTSSPELGSSSGTDGAGAIVGARVRQPSRLRMISPTRKRIGDDGQRRIHRADRGEEAGIGHVEIVEVMGACSRGRARRSPDPCRSAACRPDAPSRRSGYSCRNKDRGSISTGAAPAACPSSSRAASLSR